MFNAEEHFRAMCAAGVVTNNSAEKHSRRIKNARAELVSCIDQFFICMCAHLSPWLQATWFMLHASPPDDRIAMPPSPQANLLSQLPKWRSAGGICSPSSGTVVVYDSPEEYDEEEPPSPSPSPATKKRQHAELSRTLLKSLWTVTSMILWVRCRSCRM